MQRGEKGPSIFRTPINMFLDDLARIRVAVRGLGFNRVVQQTQGDGVNKFMQTVLKQPIILVIGAFLEEECSCLLVAVQGVV
jgi:hypothetical protein